MMKSTEQMKSRHHNARKQYSMTSFARRALFLVSFLLLSFGNVWGQEVIDRLLDESVLDEEQINPNILQEVFDNDLFYGTGKNWYDYCCTEFGKEYYVRWYVINPQGDLQPITSSSKRESTWTMYIDNDGWNASFWKVNDNMVWTDHKINDAGQPWWVQDYIATGRNYIAVPTGKKFDDFGGYTIVFEVTNVNQSPSQNNGAIPPNPLPAIKLRYNFKIPQSDLFLGKGKESVVASGGSKEIEKNVESASFRLSEAPNVSDGIKYVRIVLCDAVGNALDDQSRLTVTYNGNVENTQAGARSKNGVYVYADGTNLDLSKVNIMLNGGLGNMTQYRIKCLFSTDEMTGSGDNLKEPDWDYEYTYRFTYVMRGQFEAENINNVKTKYKTAVYDTNSRQTTIRLFSNWLEVLGDCNVSKEEFRKGAYARWYLADADGNAIDGIERLTANDSYTQLDGNFGYYREQFNSGNFRDGATTSGSGLWGNTGDWDWDYQGYNPTITLASNINYQNVHIVCVVTTLLTDMELPDQEPETMQVKYVYTLKTKRELEDAPFVHYVGESRRDYKIVDGASGITEYSWDYETGEVTKVGQNIRQDVHQTDYYVYIDPDDSNADNLILSLPIESWAVFDDEGVQDAKRNSTEPLGYFRWYDWRSDKQSEYLDIYDVSGQTKLEEKNYGLIAMMLNGNSRTPYRDEVGVKFNDAGRAALANGEIVIACDVSRYMDGIVLDGLGFNNGKDGDERAGQGYTDKYLVHEPTLSMRYLFHILPAKKIADDIDAAAVTLNELEKNGSLSDPKNRAKLFQVYDDNGRVVVPLYIEKTTGEVVGEFALRADLQDLNQYFINNGGTTIQCNNLQWYSYYEDGDGFWKMKVDMKGRNTQRLAKYLPTDFVEGEYTKVGPSSETMSVTVNNGTQLHLVGYLGNGTVEKAVIHYGLEFSQEGPEKIGSESSHRTDDYLFSQMTHGGTLDFNDFFDEATRFAKPTTSAENYASSPLAFENAQYGYCYPQLYGQCASGWQIYHGAWWNGYGIAPTHSDYTLLKTMNVPGVSASETYDQAFYTFWYDENHRQLYDVTHERLSGKDGDSNTKYGTYLYIDAADEARTIAHLEFEAALCASSEIFYTAYIANMTDLDKRPTRTPPQVMFRVSTDVVENEVKKRIPVVSFLTGDIYTQGATTSGEWYQVYGHTKIPSELEYIVNGDPRKYYVSIDNYSEDTKGADYAIDQISFFTNSAMVHVLQSSTPCDENSGIEVAIMAEANDLNNYVYDGMTLYYRLFKRNSDNELRSEDALKGPGTYKSADGTDAELWGSVKFVKDYDYETSDLPYDAPLDGTTGYYKNSTNGKVYFQFDKREFNLEKDETYFVSFYTPNQTPPNDDSDLSGWNNPYTNSICSAMFSNDILAKVLDIDLVSDGEETDGTISFGCGQNEVTKRFEITVQYPTHEGYNVHEVFFDFYMGPKRDFKAAMNEARTLYLEKALEHMRVFYTGAYESSSELPAEYKDENGIDYTQEMHDLIAKYMDEGLLILSATKTFEYTFGANEPGEKKFAAIPVSRWTTDGYICSPLEFIFNVGAGSGQPQLVLGFTDVSYSDIEDDRVVRVGKEQLDNMQKTDGGFLLHIPVNTFKTDEKAGVENVGALEIVSGFLELLATSNKNEKTNDGNVTQNIKVATFAEKEINSEDKMYISVNFHGDGVTKQTFREGFTYRMFFQIKAKGGGDDACEGDVEFLMKVVPEYVTWNDDGAVTPNANQNTNWNNDANWSRSQKAELYKTDTNNYEDNSDMGISQPPATFAPMKFTYVTIPSGNVAPNLINLTAGSDGIYNNIGNGATENIQYDLMVRYTEEKCVTPDHEGYNNTDAKIYDCEKFYGNWAKEIYFKPNAELINQQYLTYEKVWVEKELTANTWTLMSTPLQNTYAGDMYVPFEGGRQETEAFKSINFNTETYSRTKYPIYQHSWSQEGSRVYTKTNDVRATNYNYWAALKGSIDETFSQWSHTYNDVTEDYSQWKGFAIRAHKQTQDEKALIRLPKADTNYDYYQWDNTLPTDGKLTQNVGKKKTGKLFTDESENIEDVTYGVVYGAQGRTAGNGNVSVPIGEMQDAGGYLLVGNPYLCSIDMNKFLSVNDGVLANDSYWTYEDNTVPPTDKYIKPLQSFFVNVKLKDNITDGNEVIQFTPDMMIDGNHYTATLPDPSPARPITLTATTDRGQSVANVLVGEEVKSVETLFDSNLADVPMVYTVADGKAVSINQVTELSKPIAFGVTCATDELVEVTFSGIEQFANGEAVVVDAVTGEQMALAEGDGFSVQPNDYGRYYVAFSGTTGINGLEGMRGLVVSVWDKRVTVTSDEELTLVRVLSLDGMVRYHDVTGGTTKSFALASGVYILKVENVAGEEKTVKVIVR